MRKFCEGCNCELSVGQTVGYEVIGYEVIQLQLT